MEILSPEWVAALAAIVLIDLLLAGDNAVVIALAARDLPPALRRRAVWAGTAGAIFVRVALVFFALQLLQIPGLSLVGGLILYWVAWRLLRKSEPSHGGAPAAGFWAAMRTIIVADTVMGLDNILAIAGASRGDLPLVIIGFLLSIPIMVAGSMLILRAMEKAPWLVIAGSALLALVSGRMILDDPLVSERVLPALSAPTEWGLIALSTATFTAFAILATRRRQAS